MYLISLFLFPGKSFNSFSSFLLSDNFLLFSLWFKESQITGQQIFILHNIALGAERAFNWIFSVPHLAWISVHGQIIISLISLTSRTLWPFYLILTGQNSHFGLKMVTMDFPCPKTSGETKCTTK